MKVLWISHDAVRVRDSSVGSTSGFWKESLIDLLEQDRGVVIHAAGPGRKRWSPPSRPLSFRIPSPRNFISLDDRTRADILRIIDHVQPDLIHIHGTEHPYGMIARSTPIPVVVSLQGFLTECLYPILGCIPLSTWRSFATVKNAIRRSGPLQIHNQWTKKAAVEQEIVRTVRYFAGRTSFDHDFVRRFNPTARYFIAHEALRPVFHTRSWSLDSANRHTIHATSISNPLKGFHVLLEAAAILCRDFPDLRVSVAGSLSNRSLSPLLGDAYHRFLADSIRRLGLAQRIEFKGRMSGQSMSDSLCASHVFCLTSFIENSSNSLGEAMMLGLPCIVSSDCGGIPSMVEHETTALVFRKGDPYALAESIRRLWSDDALARVLGQNARRFASAFHDPKKIRGEYLAMYDEVAKSRFQ